MSAAPLVTRPRWLASSVACAAAALAPACVPTYGFTADATDGGGTDAGTPLADSGIESDADARADSSAIVVDQGFPKIATFSALFAVYSLAGASQTIGSTGTTNGLANAAPLGISLATVAPGSFVALGLLDGNGNSGVRGSTLSNTIYDATPWPPGPGTGSPSVG